MPPRSSAHPPLAQIQGELLHPAGASLQAAAGVGQGLGLKLQAGAPPGRTR
ncbi:MAG: hypothetical protein ACKO02_05220 [Cyanobium sp.]